MIGWPREFENAEFDLRFGFDRERGLVLDAEAIATVEALPVGLSWSVDRHRVDDAPGRKVERCAHACFEPESIKRGVCINVECTDNVGTSACECDKFARAILRERALLPARSPVAFAWQYPDLEDFAVLVRVVAFRMHHAGARAHDLHVASSRAADVSKVVAVGDGPGPHVGDDFHVAVRMHSEARVRRDAIVVPHAKRPEVHARVVAVLGEGEMVMRVEPTVVGTAKRFEGNEGEHASRMSLPRVAGEARMWNNIVPMAERSYEESMEGWGVFVRVVELQSFSAAARSLQMAKASVSRTMARLEERLGVPLVQRTTRSLALTEAGEVLFARARLILDDVREAEEEARALGGSVRGTLRVAAPVSFAAAHVAPYLPSFLAAHPSLRIEIEVEDRMTDLVAGRFDVALRLANLPDSALRARRLAPSRRLLAASPEYLERAGTPKKPEDLVQHACITYRHQLGTPMDQWLFRKRGSETFAVRVSGPVTIDNGEVLRGLLLAHGGIGLGPVGLLANDLRSGRLVPVLQGHLAMDASVFAVMSQKRSPPAKVRAFVDFLAHAYKPPPWEAGLEGLLGSA